MADTLKTKKVTDLPENTGVSDTDLLMVGNAGTATLRKLKMSSLVTWLKEKLGINALNTNLGSLANRLTLQKFNISVPVNAWTTLGTLTVPETGTYLIMAAFEYPWVSKGHYFARIVSNSLNQQISTAPVYNQDSIRNVCTIAHLSKGEVLSFQAYNNTAGTHGVRACIIRM